MRIRKHICTVLFVPGASAKANTFVYSLVRSGPDILDPWILPFLDKPGWRLMLLWLDIQNNYIFVGKTQNTDFASWGWL